MLVLCHQAGCDIGLERKGLCWVGGIAEKVASSFILSFEANTAGAGGAVFRCVRVRVRVRVYASHDGTKTSC